MVELKPCPFCGGEAKLVDFRDGANIIWRVVECQTCGAKGPGIPKGIAIDDAIRMQWNRRADHED